MEASADELRELVTVLTSEIKVCVSRVSIIQLSINFFYVVEATLQ